MRCMGGGGRNYLLRGKWGCKRKKERQVAKQVLAMMKGMAWQYPNGAIPVDAVVTVARKKRIPAGRLEEAIVLLKSEGMIYSSGAGRLKVTPSHSR